jgi:hypothetical protein
MRYLRLAALGLFFVAQSALAGVFVPPGHYFESPDAGSKFSPQDITGGPWVGIHGSIGDVDTVDAFRFAYLGGAFVGPLDSVIPIFTTLWTGTGPLLPISPIASPTPGFTPTWSLPPGIFIVQFSTAAGDPPFTFTNGGGLLFAPAAIPEPSTWALMLIGLAGVALARMRARRASELRLIPG